MKIASVTVTSDRSSIIGDALRSVVGWVDAAIIVDLGMDEATRDEIHAVLGGRVPVHVTEVIDTKGTTTADWRNAGMKLAQDLGFDWCVTLDTDERLQVPSNLRAFLESVNADVLMCDDLQRRYMKERFFRLPTQNWFSGHCHERIPNLGEIVHFKDVTFDELPKTPEAFRRGCEAIVESKTRELAEDPSDARNWYYLGDAHAGLEQHESAIPAFMKCADLSKWDAECAWAHLRAALSLRKLGRRWEAIECCAKGLAFHPGYAELAWLAAVCCMESGQVHHAIYWARMSVMNGKPLIHIHHGFHQHPHGTHEGPYEILRDAYALIGNEDESKSWADRADSVRVRVAA